MELTYGVVDGTNFHRHSHRNKQCKGSYLHRDAPGKKSINFLKILLQ